MSTPVTPALSKTRYSLEIVMKTPYQVQQELERLERLVPHIISD
ncbi:hypothetical protein FHR49_003405 [Xanthomonas campestris]